MVAARLAGGDDDGAAAGTSAATAGVVTWASTVLVRTDVPWVGLTQKHTWSLLTWTGVREAGGSGFQGVLPN